MISFLFSFVQLLFLIVSLVFLFLFWTFIIQRVLPRNESSSSERKLEEGTENGQNGSSEDTGRMENVLRAIETEIRENLDSLRLEENVAILSYEKEESLRAISFAKEILEKAEFKVDLVRTKDTGLPILLASLGENRKKRTVLFYGHVDVVDCSEGKDLFRGNWKSDPFKMTVKDGRIFGRGISDGKGPFQMALLAIQTSFRLNQSLPVNVKFCIDPTMKDGSPSLEEVFGTQKEFFSNIHFGCLLEGSGIQPSLAIGSRGFGDFDVKVECARQDAHSGIYGGAVPEALADLTFLLSSLVDSNGKVLIPGFYAGITSKNKENIEGTVDLEKTKEKYKGIKHVFDAKKYSNDSEASLSFHGIQGAFDGKGEKTVIPSKVIGKFSMRLLPGQKGEKITRMLQEYFENLWKKRNSPNEYSVKCKFGPVAVDFDGSSDCLRAASISAEKVYGSSPRLIRLLEPLPAANLLNEIVNGNLVAMCFASEDSNLHGPNENMSIQNMINATKQIALFLQEIAN